MFCEERKDKPLWQQAHEALTVHAKKRAMLDFEESNWLLIAKRTRADQKLGYGSFAEYVEALLGYSARQTAEKLRVAEALERLPELTSAFAQGEMHWSKVRELTRVAAPSTERAWIDASRGKKMRVVEELVSGREPGDFPGDRRKPHLEEHTIHVRVSAETMALWREMIAAVRRASSGTLSEDEIIENVARTVLGGPKDDGRASYQVVITKCDDCKKIAQRGCGREIEVAAHVGAAAECDAQRIDMREEGVPHATQEIPPAIRRMVLLRDQHRCIVHGCAHSTFVDVHHLEPRSEGGGHHPAKMGTLCGAHHRQVHAGRLIIEGDFDVGLSFKHADGTPYGEAIPNAHEANIMSDVFSALRNLGFRETDAKRAIVKLTTHVGAMSLESALRSALLYLRTGEL